MTEEELRREIAAEEKQRAQLTRTIERYRKLKKVALFKFVKHRCDQVINESQKKRDNSDERIKELKEKLDELTSVPGIEDGGWHPNATRTQVQAGIGDYLNVPPKLVWHTTEGSSLPSYSGSHPHFTFDPKGNKLFQHISIRSGAMALANQAGGVETNRAHAIQVELIGFAASTHGWSKLEYARIAALARWIEKHAGVPRKCSVTFTSASGVRRLSGTAWLNYAGHLGHQHVPENDHWDPGQFQIDEVI